jgi:hypothetical protein
MMLMVRIKKADDANVLVQTVAQLLVHGRKSSP